MAIFKIDDNDKTILSADNSKKFPSERLLEDFFVKNLETLLGVRYLERQYRILGDRERVDIIGIDRDNSPVIIELKLDRDDGILTQGQAYYGWLLENKRQVGHLVESQLGESFEVNWELPKILLVAREFSERIERAAKPLGYIELIRYSVYEPDIFELSGEQLPARLLHGRTDTNKQRFAKKQNGNMPSIYTIDQHFGILTAEEVKEKTKIMVDLVHALSEIQEDARQTGIAYKRKSRRGKFLRLEFRPTWVQVLLKQAGYKSDVKKIVEDITSFKWGYNGRIKFTEDSDTDYIFEIIKEAYEQTQ